MGGPGSGPRRDDEPDFPIAEEDWDYLVGGIKAKLKRGDPKAQVEYLLRLDELRAKGRVSSALHRDLRSSAAPRQSISMHVGAEDRTRRLEAIVEAKNRQRKAGQHLRDVGPPPDDLNTDAPKAGEPTAPTR